MTELMFDGWYTHRADAQAILDLVDEYRGMTTVGIVESAHGTFGALYLAETVMFSNHRLSSTAHPFGVLLDGRTDDHRPPVEVIRR